MIRDEDRYWGAQGTRAAIVANALSVIGVEAGDPKTRPILEELLGPVKGKWDLDRPFRIVAGANGAQVTQGISTCGLVAEGLWRRAAIDAQWLYAPYVIGSAVSRAIAFAKTHKAWNTVASNGRPQSGDYVVLGTGLSTHALTAVGWEGDTLISVDGGQVSSDGLQSIRRCCRTWSIAKKSLVGWVDVDKLPIRSDRSRYGV